MCLTFYFEIIFQVGSIMCDKVVHNVFLLLLLSRSSQSWTRRTEVELLLHPLVLFRLLNANGSWNNLKKWKIMAFFISPSISLSFREVVSPIHAGWYKKGLQFKRDTKGDWTLLLLVEDLSAVKALLTFVQRGKLLQALYYFSLFNAFVISMLFPGFKRFARDHYLCTFYFLMSSFLSSRFTFLQWHFPKSH